MTVSTTTTRNDYTASDGQTVFVYTFKVLASTDMVVVKNGVTQAGYSITNLGVATGGNVTLSSGAAAGDTVSIYLAMPITRETNYQEGGAFLAGDVNADFDKIYIGAIQNENAVSRSMRLNPIEPVPVDMTLPLKDARKGRYLQFNAVTGAPEAGQTVIGDYSAGTGLELNDYVFSIDNTVATLAGTQTLSDKTLTSPILNQDLSGSAFLDEDNMASNSSTKVASQQSIKAYVDSQVGTVDTLSEVLSNGNTTGGSSISFGTNDKATFGASDNLEIYSDGSNGYITELGTGSLAIRATDLFLQTADNELYLYGNADGAVSLYHNGQQKFITGSSGVAVTGEITADGIALGDNDKATFGAGDDLQIYHDGSNSYVSDTGTGGLYLKGSNEIALRSSSNENIFLGLTDGSAYVYHNGSVKLQTTSTGIDVTGTATMDGLTVDGTLVAPPVIRINNTGGAWTVGDEAGRLQFYTTDSTGIGAREVASIRSTTNQGGNTTDGTLEFWTSPYNTVAKKSMEIDGRTGDISFYEDTGTTPKFIWDASAESLSVGTFFSVSNTATVNLTNVLAGSGSAGSPAYSFGSDQNTGIYKPTTVYLAVTTAGTERMRIDALGNVGIGTSSPTSHLEIRGSSGGNGKQLRLSTGATTYWDLGRSASNGNFEITEGSGDTHFVINKTSGNVGIGTTSPSSILDLGSDTNTSQEIRISGGRASLGYDTTKGTSGAVVIQGSANKAIHFENTADTSAMVIDSSGNVGIGTSSPIYPLVVSNSGAQGLEFIVGNTNFIQSYNRSTSDYTPLKIDAETIAFGTDNGAERMRIDSSGNLLVGTTFYAGNSASATGSGLSDGYLWSTRQANTAAIFNRLSTDGNIVDFRKDGTTVGSIGTTSSQLYIGTGDTGLFLNSSSDTIQPINATAGTIRDGLIDLGSSGGRFKDLYLSGTAYVGTKVGIGTSSPQYITEIAKSQSGGVGPTLYLHNTVDAPVAGHAAEIRFNLRAEEATTRNAAIQAVAEGTYGTSPALTFLTSSGSSGSATERVRIDSSGNLLVGTTTNPVSSSSVEGLYYEANNYLAVATAGVTSYFNRQGTDGDIVHFRKDGTTVGSIGVYGGTTYFKGDSRSIKVAGPALVGSYSDGTDANGGNDLGSTTIKWRDLYLAGGVYLGGTGAANKLDDYESGTFTATVAGSSTAGSATYSTQGGTYEKIGDMVHFRLYVQWSSGTGAGSLQVGGLPFIPSSASTSYESVSIGYIRDLTFSGFLTAYTEVSASYIVLRENFTNAANNNLTYDGSGRLMLSGSYRAA